jgi:alpha-amylase/alpha-mannosidase (GH57 family)
MPDHKHYICIHGHFYQPPRENPWLEAIERQDSAYPYHDWNERITAECYAPNAVSRILDGKGRIQELANNYERISFNFGPTLLQWMEDHAPASYQAILDADRASIERFGGHGSALAQVFNHMIMPLASARDQRTQVIWGIRDFEHRFGRRPEGMWLAETAADIASLEALAEQGIAFTILAPNQAARVRPLDGAAGATGGARSSAPAAAPAVTEAAGAGARDGDGDGWRDVSGSRIDPTRAYLCRLPSGRQITLFFYDGPLSRAVAFEGLLRSGDRFAGRLMDMFDDRRTWPQLGHIATDGETYGHHHRHGEMALSRALRLIEERRDIRLTNYGEFLELHPPTHEVEIIEATSWSCAHGVDRWRANCGCNTGGRPDWTQEWRAPLRSALDWLASELAPRFEAATSELLTDPWAARDDYIDVILDRQPEVMAAFLARHGARELDGGEEVRLIKLLEIQRQAMLMYTSCGWFFDELSGIETVQVLQYAGRALQLADEVLERDFEADFLQRLGDARSNLPDMADGRAVYDRTVRGARVDLTEVGAHFAISSLFDEPTEQTREYCYDIEVADQELREAGRARLATGLISVMSRVTKESVLLSYGVLHLGDHTIHAGVRAFDDSDTFNAMREDLAEPFEAADFTATIQTLDRHFRNATYNLRSLFHDQRRQVLDQIIQSTLGDAENVYRQIYERNAPLMRFLRDLSIPMPTALSLAGEYVINTSLIREVSRLDVDLDRVRSLLDDARRREILLDADGIGFAFESTLEALAARLASDPDDLARLRRLEAAVRLAASAPFEVNLWNLQNATYDLLRDHSGTVRARVAAGDAAATRWLESFASLAELVGVAVER